MAATDGLCALANQAALAMSLAENAYRAGQKCGSGHGCAGAIGKAALGMGAATAAYYIGGNESVRGKVEVAGARYPFKYAMKHYYQAAFGDRCVQGWPANVGISDRPVPLKCGDFEGA
jgi:hypothetical protein